MDAIASRRSLWSCLTLLALAAFPPQASAQWSRVPEVPSTDMFTVTAKGDTIAAGADSVVYISTDAGATWKRSAPVATGIVQVDALLIRNGRVYAGTLQNHGVLVSDDLGDTWAAYNQGLSGLGALDIIDLMAQGDSLYLATIGGGAWVRHVSSGPWIHFGDQIEALQADNMTAIAAGGSRLFAAGGFNGTVFYRDPGDPDWTLSLLFNDRFAPGLAGLSAIWTGHRWVVGSNIGIFYSDTGHEPWTYVDFGIHPTLFVGFAMSGSDLFASMGAGGGTLITMSPDDGATWQSVDSLFSVFTYKLARVDTTLYAGRVDGLWRRSLPNMGGPARGHAGADLAFSIGGRQPVRDHVRFEFDLPTGGSIEIEVFDVMGRRVGHSVRASRPAGHGEIDWDASRLAAGVYYARLNAGGRRARTRLVHLR